MAIVNISLIFPVYLSDSLFISLSVLMPVLWNSLEGLFQTYWLLLCAINGATPCMPESALSRSVVWMTIPRYDHVPSLPTSCLHFLITDTQDHMLSLYYLHVDLKATCTHHICSLHHHSKSRFRWLHTSLHATVVSVLDLYPSRILSQRTSLSWTRIINNSMFTSTSSIITGEQYRAHGSGKEEAECQK